MMALFSLSAHRAYLPSSNLYIHIVSVTLLVYSCVDDVVLVQVFPDKAQYPPEEDWDDTWSEGPPSH